MKKFILYILPIITFILGWYIGNKEYEIPSIKMLDGYESADLYDGNFTDDQLIGTIKINNIIHILQDCKWKNNNPISKGSYKLKLGNNIKLKISYYGNFYWIVGVPGYYAINEQKRNELGAILGKLLNDKIIPWRKNKYS